MKVSKTINDGDKGDSMQLVLEGKTLQELGEEAQKFLDDLEEGDSAPAPTNIGDAPKRGRGRPTKAAASAAAAAARADAATTAPPPASLPASHPANTGAGEKPAAAATNPTPAAPVPSVSKDQLVGAMRELIAFKGNGDVKAGAALVAAFLKAEFAPATRATEIPEADWPRFVMRVRATIDAKPPPTADDLV